MRAEKNINMRCDQTEQLHPVDGCVFVRAELELEHHGDGQNAEAEVRLNVDADGAEHDRDESKYDLASHN